MPKIMRNGVAYGKGGKIIIHNGVSYGGSHIAKLIEKTITANGTYDASDDGVDGYSEVSVNVKPNNIDIMHTDNLLWGVELNATGGTQSSVNTTFVTDYFDIGGYAKLHIMRSKYTGIAFYDSERTFISKATGVTTGIITIPSGAKYMRFEGYSSARTADDVRALNAAIVFNEA